MKFKVALPPKTCKVCGRHFTRRDDEEAFNYRKRKTCGEPACARKIQSIAKSHEPAVDIPLNTCAACGKQYPKRSYESAREYRARVYCSLACHNHGQRKKGAVHRAANPRQRNRQKIAPEGYKWSGKFPTPEGIKPTWVSITGPELPPAQPKRTSGPKPDLRAILEDHPDLAAALAGTLTDSWFPYSRTSSVKGASTDS